MPKLDQELRAQGYLPILPQAVYAAAEQKQGDYLLDFTSKAILKDGMFYISRNDYNEIARKYGGKELKKDPIKNTIKGPNESIHPRVERALDLDKECKETDPRWLSVLEKYKIEVTAKKKEGCTNCQLNAIKSKYRKILTTLLEKQNAENE